MKIIEIVRGAMRVPPPPGQAPIPSGMVRRFHYTSSENIPSIAEHGLLISHSHGASVGDPVAIWSTPDFPKDSPKPIVEFWDDPSHYQRHPYARSGDIGVQQIVAVHEPWHESYRYVKENNVSLADLRRVGDAMIMNEGENRKMTYGQLADILQAEGWQ